MPNPHPDLRLSDGRRAPRLLIQFQCPACHVSEVRDAFLGVAMHACRMPHPIMVAERIVPNEDVIESEVPGR